MTVPAFHVGQTGDVGGMRYRILNGAKADRDIVLEMRSDDWCRVPMAVGLLAADFHYQDEDILHPTINGERGGEYFLSAVSEACRENGWAFVAARIERERNGGARPTYKPYRAAAPYEGRHEVGLLVGRIRTSVMAELWGPQNGRTPQQILDAVQAVVDRYREEL